MNLIHVIKHCLKIPTFQSFYRSLSIIRDKHFEYFRSKADYKNSAVLLSDDLNNKIAGPGFSFLIQDNLNTDRLFSHLMQRENVMKLSNVQLKEIMCLLANLEINTKEHSILLKYLDEKCSVSVERWPIDLTLYVLDAWFIIMGPKVFKKYYYSAVTSLWSRRIKKSSKYNLIQMLYFVGVSKEAPPFFMEMIEDRMENIKHDFTDVEWAIVCLSFFKTSKPMKSGVLLNCACTAAENLLLKDDKFNLISILKCLRLSRHFNDNLWEKLEKYIIQNYKFFNFVECTNFLATFATQNMYNDIIFHNLEEQGIFALSQEQQLLDVKEDQPISKIHPAIRSRVKDLARFLWAFSSLGHCMKENSRSFIINLLEHRLKMGEFELQLHVLVDCLQSFALMSYYPQNLLEYSLKSSFLNKLQFTNRAKPNYQLYFICKSIEIECPDMEFVKAEYKYLNPIPKNLQKEINERQGFRTILNFLEQNMDQNEFKFCYLMPHVMIAGIIVSSKTEVGSSSSLLLEQQKFSPSVIQKLLENGLISKQAKMFFQVNRLYTCIEILDPSVCIHGSTEPVGLMKTKIRHLKKLNFNVITVTPNEIFKLVQSRNCTEFNKIASLIT